MCVCFFFLLQIRGSMRVILRPLIPAAPLVGGVSVFFLNRPVSKYGSSFKLIEPVCMCNVRHVTCSHGFLKDGDLF